MDTRKIVTLLEARQDISDARYGKRIGLSQPALWRYKNGKSTINLAAREKLIAFFAGENDAEMVGALLTYGTNDEIDPAALAEIGQRYLDAKAKAA